ncbi:hypothetical protein QYF36_013354 [Acer negundo]|nr:hypothetical protein QYF36_013354 [Acer negundo]
MSKLAQTEVELHTEATALAHPMFGKIPEKFGILSICFRARSSIWLVRSTYGTANLNGCATTTTSSAKSALMKDCVLRDGDLSFLDTCLQENSRHNQLSFPELQKFLVGQEKITDERKTADGSVVQQDGVTAARSGRKDGKDDEGIDTSSFHPRSWPHVLVREGRRQRGCLTANSGFTTTRGLDGDEWVSSLLISE